MERLTKKIDRCTVFPEELVGVTLVPDNPIMCKLLLRLAAYEDTGLMPEEVSALIKDWSDLCATIGECGGIDLVKELAESDKDGRLVVLPCKVGDTIYHISRVRTSHFEDDKIIIDDEGRLKIYEMPFTLIHLPYIGKSYFLTREEAEKALEAMKNE